jgi:tRNA threonylcarbamoyladenosine biosynthesis protein TsaE
MEITINSTAELDQTAAQLLEFAQGRKKMVFTAEIGAGKTTLIKALTKLLGVKEQVTSPTFSLINEYSFKDKSGQEQLIHHIDLYRLNNIQEALDIGIEDYLYGDAYTFIEWPELVESLLPENIVRINIEILDNSSRKILFL